MAGFIRYGGFLAQNDSLKWLLRLTKWLCCQLGAREHYAIPRALFRLECLTGW